VGERITEKSYLLILMIERERIGNLKGKLFFFVWRRALRKAATGEKTEEKEVHGNLFAIHGGGESTIGGTKEEYMKS